MIDTNVLIGALPRNQIEGGTLQSMSRALFEEISWGAGTLTSVDWMNHPVYKFGMFLPKVETVLVNRPDVVRMGAGETAPTIVAAAIGNAVFDATGARLREVLFTPARVLAALGAR